MGTKNEYLYTGLDGPAIVDEINKKLYAGLNESVETYERLWNTYSQIYAPQIMKIALNKNGLFEELLIKQMPKSAVTIIFEDGKHVSLLDVIDAFTVLGAIEDKEDKLVVCNDLLEMFHKAVVRKAVDFEPSNDLDYMIITKG